MFNMEDLNWFCVDFGNYGINVFCVVDIVLLIGIYIYDIFVQGLYNLCVGDFVGYNLEVIVLFIIMFFFGFIFVFGSVIVVKLMLKLFDLIYNVVLVDIFLFNLYLGCVVIYGVWMFIKMFLVIIFNGGVILNIFDCEFLKLDKMGVRIKVFICILQVLFWQGEMI